MKYILQNDFLQISVIEKGAELCSIKSKKNEEELMWQADSNIWGSHAPNLFPVIGCLKNDGFIYEGKEYPMTKHGFVRNNPDVKLIKQTNKQLSFCLSSSESTLKLYPFEFEFRIHYKLEGNKIRVIHEVENLSNKEMYFCLGGHPAFACSVDKNASYSDYYLEFPEAETVNTWNLTHEGLIKSEGDRILDSSKILNLRPDLFANDALIFKNLKSSSVSLKCKSRKDFELKVSYPDFPYLGLWAKPNAPYVCIEPWIGIADSCESNRDFTQKEQIQKLSALDTFTAEYSIEVK